MQTSNSHTVRAYDQELSELNSLVLRMGGVVLEQFDRAVQAFCDDDTTMAHMVISRDHMVNLMDVQADASSMSLLARRQPMGRDLRTIIALSKSVTDLERIGDEARRIAQITNHLLTSSTTCFAQDVPRQVQTMAHVARTMLAQCLESLARLDVDLALKVTRDDVELNNAFQSVLSQLTCRQLDDAQDIDYLVNATLMLRSIERIGDHAQNVAESVIFLVKGADIRHVSTRNLAQEL